jgi:hypothetical protein
MLPITNSAPVPPRRLGASRTRLIASDIRPGLDLAAVAA